MIVTALSISRSLIGELKFRPFAGRVLGRFEHACNLVDAHGRIIALTLPEIGNGPFSIRVAGQPGCFESFSTGESATANLDNLTVGSWYIDLKAAQIWEPRLACPSQPFSLNPAIASLIQPYTDWPNTAETGLAASQRLSEAAFRLNQAITQAEGSETDKEIMAAAGQLAGLGSGLTPAGDDFLVGVIAALWLTGQRALLPKLADVAAPRTTALSAAFLRAAAQGEFIEPWHVLAQALCTGEVESFRRAVEEVAQFGASSGRDALAGFAATIRAKRLI
ncbi:MAG: DUF2877 domain-containing protein [Anaerolineales bacterium]|nr:DUF2877 domain-containing protein [Anaerolineales bacterium]